MMEILKLIETILLVIAFSLTIGASVYSIKVDRRKAKAVERMNELTHGLELIMRIPIKKAREILESNEK